MIAFHNNSVPEALADLFPNVSFDRSKFEASDNRRQEPTNHLYAKVFPSLSRLNFVFILKIRERQKRFSMVTEYHEPERSRSPACV